MRHNKSAGWLACFGLLIGLSGCQSLSPSASKQNTLPRWLTTALAHHPEQIGKPDQVFRFIYRQRPYFYLTASCCDRFNTVYTDTGQRVCAPDGGFTGRGDGKCPDNLHIDQVSLQRVWPTTTS